MDQDTPSSASPHAQAISLYIQNAIDQLKQNTSDQDNGNKQDNSGLIFLGNWQDAFPRLLVTDPILEPVDKIVWQIIRIHVNAPGAVTAFPSYESISTHANIKSNHTISRALAILRTTRWLSLCERVRSQSGRYLGNIYVLHDEPVTLGDAMYLDNEYMAFLQESLQHNHPRVRKIAESVLATIQDQINDDRDALGERIHTRSYERRINSNNTGARSPEAGLILAARTDFFAIADTKIKTLDDSTKSQGNTHVHLLHTVKTEESGHVQNSHMDNQTKNSQVQKMHSDTDKQKLHTVLHSSSNNINTITTCSSTSSENIARTDELYFPDDISANERDLALMYLKPIPINQRQDVLDEWNGRLLSATNRNAPIDNPIGYLATLCRRAKSDEFQLTIGLRVRDKREQRHKQAEAEKRRSEIEQQRQQEIAASVVEKPEQRLSPIEKRLRQIQEQAKKDDAKNG
ncbi:MAG: STY4528 family pathogenicity island replication protein [Candidatus Thiodiazotropha sp. 6PDIVS]